MSKHSCFCIFLMILLSLTISGCTSERYEDVVERNKKVDEEISKKEELEYSELNDLVLEALEYGKNNSLTGDDIEWIELASKYSTLPSKQGTTQKDIDAAVVEIKQARSKARNSRNVSQEDKSEVDEKSSMTVSQSNAVSKAKSYLSYSSFSHDGLVKQLEYEKFSHEDAMYGADNCGADWKEQAAKKAKDYLEYSSFSHDSLIDQLIYEGFTQEQAEYGVSTTGL